MSDDDRQRAIDKLTKLLALAESENEHEAENAAARAAELMAKHQLSEADVEARRSGGARKPMIERGRIDADETAPFSRVENWHKSLAACLADVFGGKMWSQGRGKLHRLMMMGTPDAIASTRYMYASLVRQVGVMSREAGRRLNEPSNAWRRTYCLGVVSRIYDRMITARQAAFKSSVATSTALVVIDSQKAALAERWEAEMTDVKASKRGARKRPDASVEGWTDGAGVDVGGGRALSEGRKALK